MGKGGPSGLTSAFEKTQFTEPGNQPYIKADIRVSATKLQGAFYIRLTNFDHINSTGKFPLKREQEPYEIDWKVKDAFTRTMKEIGDKVYERIQKSPELQKLLKKEQWSMSERENWEEKVSTIVSEEVDEVPGFAAYRSLSSSEKKDIDPNSPSAKIKNIYKINDLSSDIENKTGKKRFDCTTMSIVEGSVLQKCDRRFLPAKAAEGDFKIAANYFYAEGRQAFPGSDSFFNHTFLISSATGNMIESTADPDKKKQPYIRSENNYTFEEFAAGRPFVGKDGSVYTSFYFSLDLLDADMKRKEALVYNEALQSVSSQAAEKTNGELIKALQSELGIKITGTWGPQTTEAFAKRMAQVQSLPAHKGPVNFFYDEKTEQVLKNSTYPPAFKAVVQILDQRGVLDKNYTGPKDPAGILKSLEKDKPAPEKTRPLGGVEIKEIIPSPFKPPFA
jgi:hypothetical protein